jgi:hypothetical protein
MKPPLMGQHHYIATYGFITPSSDPLEPFVILHAALLEARQAEFI